MATKMPAACLFASAPILTWVYNVKSTLSYTMVTWVKVFRIIPEFRIAENAELKTYAAISNAHLSRVCKRGKFSGSCLSTLNGFGSTQLLIFLCHIGVPTFSSQNN